MNNHPKDCSCCRGTRSLTPEETANRAGLSEISYRIGTHATFFESMLSRISSETVERPLEEIEDWTLTAEEVRDFTRLRKRFESGQDPLTRYLRPKLGLGPGLDMSRRPDNGELVERLNGELAKTEMHATDNIPHIDLSQRLRNLLSQSDKSGDDIVRLSTGSFSKRPIQTSLFQSKLYIR